MGVLMGVTFSKRHCSTWHIQPMHIVFHNELTARAGMELPSLHGPC